MIRAARGRRSSDRARNQAHIRRLAAQAPTDLEALALLFEDDGIVDDGTVGGRLRAILQATERRTIPGLYTAVPFGDTGFAGDRRPGGAGFRDPWPASRNQVGHLLTAVAMRCAPEVVSRPIPILGSIRAMIGAPATMADADVALRLSIGHEKLADPPNAAEAALLVLARGFVAARQAIATDASVSSRARRIALAMIAEACVQVLGSLSTFRAQFHATSDDDLAAWREALRRAVGGSELDRDVVEGSDSPLRAIVVGSGEGNSMQDLRLTFAGWQLGDMLARGAFKDRKSVAAWIRQSLG